MVRYNTVTASDARRMRTMRTQGVSVADIWKAFPKYCLRTVYNALKKDSRAVVVERKVMGAVRQLRKAHPYKKKPFGRVKIARATGLSKKIVQRALKRCRDLPGQKRTYQYGCKSVVKRRAKLMIESMSQPIEERGNNITPGGRGNCSQGWA